MWDTLVCLRLIFLKAGKMPTSVFYLVLTIISTYYLLFFMNKLTWITPKFLNYEDDNFVSTLNWYYVNGFSWAITIPCRDHCSQINTEYLNTLTGACRKITLSPPNNSKYNYKHLTRMVTKYISIILWYYWELFIIISTHHTRQTQTSPSKTCSVCQVNMWTRSTTAL